MSLEENKNKKKVKYKDGTQDEHSDDKYISLPYNKKNILATVSDIENLLAKYGINCKVIDMNVFLTALTHKSYIEKDFDFTKEMYDECEDYPEAIPLQKKSYEMLEFYGDSVADKYVRKYLCTRFHESDEGVLTKLKTKLVDTSSFSNFARKMNLTKYIIISKQVEGMDNGLGRASDEFRKILEDVFEAFIGAMDLSLLDLELLNKNYTINEYKEFMKTYQSPCEKLIYYLLENYVDFAELLYNDTNYKNQLLQYYHKMQWGNPEYKMEEYDGPAHKRIFKMYVCDNQGKKIGSGTGKRKKDGEQLSAKQALIYLGVIEEDDDVIDLTEELFI
jgi:ribonuclease-3